MTSAIALKFIFFGLIALAVALEVVGDIFFKKWSIFDSSTLWVELGVWGVLNISFSPPACNVMPASSALRSNAGWR